MTSLPDPIDNPEALLQTRDARGVVRLTLNRPDVRNAFDEPLIALIRRTFEALAQDDSVRVIVLDAVGSLFCAGADIGWMRRAAARDQAANLEDARQFAAMMHAMASCPHPVVARIQGAAYGGGVGLACAADIAIASDKALFSVSEARFGILPAVIGPYVVNTVGLRQARRLALTAAPVNAAEALAMGLVHQVTTPEALDATVETTIGQLLNNGPKALTEIKRLMDQLEVGPITESVRELTAHTISRVRAGSEAREGFAAFVAKQPAPWVPPTQG